MESYTPIGLHQRLLREKLIYDFISPGPRRFVSFCIQFHPRLLALSIQLAQLWGRGEMKMAIIFLSGRIHVWKEKTFKTGGLYFLLLCGGCILTFRFVDLSPRAQEVRYIGKLKEACQIKSIRLFCWIALCVSLGQGSGFSSRNWSGKPIQHWPSKPN